jgi:hypothetical protein
MAHPARRRGAQAVRAAARKMRAVYGAIALVCMGLVTVHGLWKLCQWIAS